jgi:hypothetical protein
MAATAVVAVAMATASDICVEGICVIGAAAGGIIGSTMVVKASAR